MPRSQSESENVQFVQELAEVDGPFESPININFRDLTKLELPSLVWNRGETCPKKMKITNTGHTVIISGKWKCERPYLTGGPLTGKYVFSQIHFHWGQDDCGGSEHLVCGDGFPLEMHVAHFKTEYLTQESALREKDGMVVVVYFFKIQDEPNQSLKKIIDLLPCLKQASTSHEIDPRPIVSLCKPFADDYFMYWGSVVTSTCAHILLWIICREPCGISKEQVMEFRKIMDSSQQPISKNSRDVQPLHSRNVFHVNASKHLEEPLLPIRNILGCYCRQGGESVELQQPHICVCEQPMEIQEDVEGTAVDCFTRSDWWHDGGARSLDMKMNLRNDCFAKQTIFVQRATVSVLLKRFDSEPVGVKPCCVKKNDKTTVNIGTKSCCFFTLSPVRDRKIQKRKTPLVKRSFKNGAAFSQIMNSLEFLKNQTSKKLKEIESINQEIKGMRMFCQPTEDSRWLGKIEKMIKKQKRFNFKYSDPSGCFGELRKIAKDCNLKFLPEEDFLSEGDEDTKGIWVYNDGETKETFLNSKQGDKPSEEEDSSKYIFTEKDQMVPENAHKLLENFFEDIKESDEEKLGENLKVKKVGSFCSKPDESDEVSNKGKGYITENMFVTGNLEGRFFQEVIADEFEIVERVVVPPKYMQAKIVAQDTEGLNRKDKPSFNRDDSESPTEQMIPIRKGNYFHLLPKKSIEAYNNPGRMGKNGVVYGADANTEYPLISESVQSSESKDAHSKKHNFSPIIQNIREKGNLPDVSYSTSNLSTESDESHRMIIAKFRKKPFIKDSWDQKSLMLEKNTYMPTCKKKPCKEIEGYYIHRRNAKHKRGKRHINDVQTQKSSSSKEDLKTVIKKLKWKGLRKAKFRLEIEKTSRSSSELELKHAILNSKSRKFKLKKQSAIKWTPKNEQKEVIGEPHFLQFLKEQESELKLNWSKSDHKNKLKTSPKLIIASSSADSELSLSKNSDANESEEGPQKHSPYENKLEIPTQTKVKPIVKNRSLGSLISQRSTTDSISHKYHESFSRRTYNGNEIPRAIEKFPREFSSNQICMSGDERKQLKHEVESNLKFFASKKMDEELLPKNQVKKISKSVKTLKRCDVDKYHFLENKFTHTPTVEDLVDEYPDILNQTDSNRSFAINASKGDAELEKLNYQASVSFLTLKMSSPSRPHSAETLSSTKQIFKRRSKKRPHCCKRSSRHYIRKNSSIFKKLNKTDSKHLNVQNLTEESQFQIISLNIQKYFQQKLENQYKNIDPNKTCSLIILNISNAEKVMLTRAKVTKTKKPTQPEESLPIKDKGGQKIPVRATKPKEKRSPQTLNLMKPKTPSNSTLESLETEKRASILPSVDKLNKQIVDDDKNKIPSLEKLDQPNEKKPPENQEKIFKSKIPKKRVQKTENIKTENLDSKRASSQKKPNPTLRKLPIKEKQTNRSKMTAKTTEKNKNAPTTQLIGRLCRRKSNQALQEISSSQATARGKNLLSTNSALSKPARETQKGKPRKESPKKSKKNTPGNNSNPPNALNPTPQRSVPSKVKKTVVSNEKKQPSQVPKPPTDVAEINKNDTIKVHQPKEQTAKTTNLLEKKISLPFNSISSSYMLTSINTIENQSTGDLYNIKGHEKKFCTTTLQQNLSERKFNFPINLLSPCISSSIDLLSRQHASKYLMDPYSLDYYSSEDIFDPNCVVPEGKSTFFSKELEYFVKLRMLFNSEISGKKNLLENPSINDLQCLDSLSKKTVMMESTEMECISSCSKFMEESVAKKVKPQSSNTKLSNESTDSKLINLMTLDRAEESNSDSSYEYKISITLNTIQPRDCFQSEKALPEVRVPQDCILQETSSLGEEEENALEQEISVAAEKLQKKKRNENEMSMEMKQKLIEIFEEEIHKGIRIIGSSENLSDENTNVEDSDKTYSQSSIMTSYENLEILHQISDTMKEYLMDLKENGQLEKILNKSVDLEKS